MPILDDRPRRQRPVILAAGIAVLALWLTTWASPPAAAQPASVAAPAPATGQNSGPLVLAPSMTGTPAFEIPAAPSTPPPSPPAAPVFAPAAAPAPPPASPPVATSVSPPPPTPPPAPVATSLAPPAAAQGPAILPSPPPCPPGTTPMWSRPDIAGVPVFICHRGPGPR